MKTLNAKNFGLALGILWGVSVFIIGLLAGTFGWDGTVEMLATWYKGYGSTFVGSLIGLVWGFLDGFIGGFVLIWLYNQLEKRS